MSTLQIIDVIKRWPLSEKLRIIELIFRNIREETLEKEDEQQRRREAAGLLLEDYQNDEELTAFTVLDKEDFHEKE